MTEAEAHKKIQDVAYKINSMAELEGIPVALSYLGGLLFASGTAGLAGNISRADFLKIAGGYFDNAQSHRKRLAN